MNSGPKPESYNPKAGNSPWNHKPWCLNQLVGLKPFGIEVGASSREAVCRIRRRKAEPGLCRPGGTHQEGWRVLRKVYRSCERDPRAPECYTSRTFTTVSKRSGENDSSYQTDTWAGMGMQGLEQPQLEKQNNDHFKSHKKYNNNNNNKSK